MALYSLNDVAPEISERCYVADNATLIGRVRLRAGATVWFGAVLRGDNEWIDVGERSNVQDNCTFHTDPGFPLTIGSNCTIGHNCILHGCTIGDGSLIGMGAIVLNGAKIGSNCIVGAGALVRESGVVPDNTLVVGSPARQVRSTDDAVAKMLAQSADIYYQRGLDYAANLRRVG
jgi:carbonic anhydrase/acetyltransferase-like protein (isoleucine patch superfamily)